jgi:hypothetical protein
MVVELPQQKRSWYQIRNPSEVKQRVVLSNSYPTSLMILAEKIKDTNDILLNPFQSDYAHVWAVYDSMKENKRMGNERALLHYYRRLAPEFIKKIVRNVVYRKLNKVENVEELGVVNPHFFTKIDF